MIDKNEDYICFSCGDKCYLHEETTSYSGTHCTNGMSGTCSTGYLVSSCCAAEYVELTHKEVEWCVSCDKPSHKDFGVEKQDEWFCNECDTPQGPIT